MKLAHTMYLGAECPCHGLIICIQTVVVGNSRLAVKLAPPLSLLHAACMSHQWHVRNQACNV